MQNRNPVVNIPLLMGIGLSLALHAAALYSKGMEQPSKPMLEAGRTVVHLTLMPSITTPEVEKQAEPQEEARPEETFEAIEPMAQKIAVANKPEPAPETVPEAKPAPKETDPLPEPSVPANEQLASMEEEKGVATVATPQSTIRPAYPRISQRRGEEGTVILSIEVLENGRAGHIEILQSSGFNRLDDAAIDAVARAGYQPATRLGKPIRSEIIQPLAFELVREP